MIRLFLKIFITILTIILPKTMDTIHPITTEKVVIPKEQQILESLSLEEKVGQLFIFGFSGTDISDELDDLLLNKHIGGVIYLRSNIESQNKLKELNSRIQEYSHIPIFTAIDQEGGVVSRLSGNEILTLSQKDITTCNAYDTAKARGEILKDLGINMNFAPVIEYITNPSSFMYPRVFTGKKDEVIYKSLETIRGYDDSGIISVPKHYPSHPDNGTDSHTHIPEVSIKKDEWDNFIYTFKRVLPFSKATMTGHISFPNIDDNPTTISEELINQKLRKDLLYQGVIITDDMNMESMRKLGKPEVIAKEALLAGNDILLYLGTYENQLKVYHYILEEIRNDNIDEELINEKVLRILRLKLLISDIEIQK